MSNSSNQSVIRELFGLIEKGDQENVGKVFSANWVNHDPSLPPMQGLEGARQLIALWGGLSSREFCFEEIFSAGNLVAVRFSLSGTHTGELMGIAATGKSVDVSGNGIFRVVDGKATDNWVIFDALGFLRQLGALPMPGQ